MGTAFADKAALAAAPGAAQPRKDGQWQRLHRLGTAALVKVAAGEARRVPVAILDKPFGGADGLLGRSFLSRFDVVVGATRWTLKPRAQDP